MKGNFQIKVIIVFLILVFLIAGKTYTQSFEFKSIPVRDDLPVNSINSIIQDKKGFKLGSESGLIRWRGGTFSGFC